MEKNSTDIWKAQVRDYEVDFQGIVNNANYLHYFDEARSLFLYNRGINLKEYADNGFNLILISTTISYKVPLRFSEQFVVKSTFSQCSKIRFACDQTISLLKDGCEIECAFASSIVCAVKNGKPIHLKELSDLLI